MRRVLLAYTLKSEAGSDHQKNIDRLTENQDELLSMHYFQLLLAFSFNLFFGILLFHQD